jgi:PTH1 family peptidyl-tRNA hydrolase
MNLTGEAIGALLDETRAEPENALVVLDDFNLPVGAVRVRSSGSDGGHNGLASIIETLGTENFPRLRLGIGFPADNQEAAEYVLGRFLPEEAEIVQEMVAKAAEAAIFALHHPLEEVMARYNRNPAPPEND